MRANISADRFACDFVLLRNVFPLCQQRTCQYLLAAILKIESFSGYPWTAMIVSGIGTVRSRFVFRMCASLLACVEKLCIQQAYSCMVAIANCVCVVVCKLFANISDNYQNISVCIVCKKRCNWIWIVVCLFPYKNNAQLCNWCAEHLRHLCTTLRMM